MNITLRKKVLKDGRESLFLDYYLPKESQKRKKETLKLYLSPNPKTKLEKANNKKILELAKSIRAKRLLSLQHNHYEFSHLIQDNLENTSIGLVSYCQQDMKSKWHGKSTYYAIKGLTNYIEKYQNYKDIALKEITEAWVRGFKEFLLAETLKEDKKALTWNTVNIYYGRLRLIFTKAVNENLIQRSPALHVPNIKMEDTQREFLTLEELKLVTKTPCKDIFLKKAFIFSALTGLRGSDITKLKWREVEYIEGRGWHLRFTQKKTKGVETLPIPNQARELLGEKKGNDELVLRFKTSQYTTERLRKWLASAGIHKKITFHCARHTFATLQLTLGTDIYTVSKLLGHKSISTTQIYGKIIDQKKVDAVNRIPDLNL